MTNPTERREHRRCMLCPQPYGHSEQCGERREGERRTHDQTFDAMSLQRHRRKAKRDRRTEGARTEASEGPCPFCQRVLEPEAREFLRDYLESKLTASEGLRERVAAVFDHYNISRAISPHTEIAATDAILALLAPGESREPDSEALLARIREDYTRVVESEWFQRVYAGKSLGEVIGVDDAVATPPAGAPQEEDTDG